MDYYFLYDSYYVRDEKEKALMKFGFEKVPFKVCNHTAYQYIKDGMKINLTSASEGKIQVQTFSDDRLPEIKDLVQLLKPKKVINSCFEDIFFE